MREFETNMTVGSSVQPMAKPLKAISRLISLFRTESVPLVFENEDCIVRLHNPSGELHVLLVVEGLVDAYRTSDELLFATAAAPAIFGMQGSAYRYDMYTFQSNPDSKLETLPLTRAIELVAQHGLLEDLLAYQIYFNDYQAYRNNLLINKSAYEIVCALLFELEKIPADKRAHISVLNFILARSHLARSGIMKILANLRQGLYINIENGKLISIIRKFPKEY